MVSEARFRERLGLLERKVQKLEGRWTLQVTCQMGPIEEREDCAMKEEPGWLSDWEEESSGVETEEEARNEGSAGVQICIDDS